MRLASALALASAGNGNSGPNCPGLSLRFSIARTKYRIKIPAVTCQQIPLLTFGHSRLGRLTQFTRRIQFISGSHLIFGAGLIIGTRAFMVFAASLPALKPLFSLRLLFLFPLLLFLAFLKRLWAASSHRL